MKPEVAQNGRIAGTRITVWDVVHYLEHGRSLEYIAGVLPLSMDELKSAVGFIESNREYVYRVHEQIEERNRRGNPPEIQAKLVESEKRMKQWLENRKVLHAAFAQYTDADGQSPEDHA